MEQLKNLFTAIGRRLREMARGNAVVARPISVGNHHLLPLCELGFTFGGGGGQGEEPGEKGEQANKGEGGAVFGGAKACPVAVVIIEEQDVRIEYLGQ